MKVVIGLPPNYDEIQARFGFGVRDSYFAWGNLIYSPRPRTEIDLGVVAHESVHQRQQRAVGGPEIWWRRYLDDPDFRREQEIEAYQVQHAFYKSKLPRKVMRQVTKAISKEMSGPTYGRMMTRQDALAAITTPLTPKSGSKFAPRVWSRELLRTMTPAVIHRGPLARLRSFFDLRGIFGSGGG